ncbi:MAG: redoxin domain-containing protein [Psychroflexus sp.]|nr:redoxin domain-containing protein [Psychroflexus sp.]MDN6310980.1 redoxin domain-containing protein [Psychroflexus sp.]
MDKKKKNKNTKRTWIQYGIFAFIGITLYATGLHAEVIGFAQRGLLATGIMNPDVEEIAQTQDTADGNQTANMAEETAQAEIAHAKTTQQGNTQTESAEKKETPAAFNLKMVDKDGQTKSLADLKGKVIFMNFWATWCPPCIAEMPSIDELHDEVGDEVAFVLLSFDDNFETSKKFNESKGYNLPIYEPTSQIPKMYQSRALPTTYVIDAEGNLAWTHKGMADYSDPEFIEFIKDLM